VCADIISPTRHSPRPATRLHPQAFKMFVRVIAQSLAALRVLSFFLLIMMVTTQDEES
jgi:hypothetical protein